MATSIDKVLYRQLTSSWLLTLNSADIAPRDKLARIEEQLLKPCSLSLFLEIIRCRQQQRWF